jgi:hypothetical protein
MQRSSHARQSSRRPLDPRYVHGFVDTVFGENLHALRVVSLANGVTGVMKGAVLSLHAIGQAYASFASAAISLAALLPATGARTVDFGAAALCTRPVPPLPSAATFVRLIAFFNFVAIVASLRAGMLVGAVTRWLRTPGSEGRVSLQVCFHTMHWRDRCPRPPPGDRVNSIVVQGATAGMATEQTRMAPEGMVRSRPITWIGARLVAGPPFR